MPKNTFPNRIILIFIFFIFLLGSLNASELVLTLQPHYYNQGTEIFYDNSTTFTGISFEIIGKNAIQDSRILQISIINASPIEFYNALPKIPVDYLRILQEKTLFVSQIIPASNLNRTNFSVDIIGFNEKTQEAIYSSASKEISIPKKEDVFEKIGNRIMPSNSLMGWLIGIGFVVLITFVLWMYSAGQKLSEWKRNRQLKKIAQQKEKERIKKMYAIL